MVNNKQLKNKQKELDEKNWLDSENSEDKCGSYKYCEKCDKTQEYPCARAYFYFVLKNKTIGENMENFTNNVELPAIALKIRSLRIQKGLSIENLANECKINLQDLLLYELGKKEPSKKILKKVLNFLN